MQEEGVADIPDMRMTKEMQEMKDAEEENWREENLLTQADLKIASTDIPERIQLKKSLFFLVMVTPRFI